MGNYSYFLEAKTTNRSGADVVVLARFDFEGKHCGYEMHCAGCTDDYANPFGHDNGKRKTLAAAQSHAETCTFSA